MMTAYEYLTQKRGIHPSVAEYAAWQESYNEYCIPYFDARGTQRTVRYHNPSGTPKYRSKEGSTRHLYCVENVRFSSVFLCEGEIDTLSALSVGVKAVGVPGANSFFRPWIHLMEHTDDLVIAFDGDAAGRESAIKIKSLLPHAKILEVPSDTDLNDILRHEGAETLKEFLSDC